jgi:hypothetical protein
MTWVSGTLGLGEAVTFTVSLVAEKGSTGLYLDYLALAEFSNGTTGLPEPSRSGSARSLVSYPPFFQVTRNMFNPGLEQDLEIRFATSIEGPAGLTVYNSAGELVKRLWGGSLTPGRVERVRWDGTNQRAEHCASGVYLLSLEMRGLVQTRRVALIR